MFELGSLSEALVHLATFWPTVIKKARRYRVSLVAPTGFESAAGILAQCREASLSLSRFGSNEPLRLNNPRSTSSVAWAIRGPLREGRAIGERPLLPVRGWSAREAHRRDFAAREVFQVAIRGFARGAGLWKQRVTRRAGVPGVAMLADAETDPPNAPASSLSSPKCRKNSSRQNASSSPPDQRETFARDREPKRGRQRSRSKNAKGARRPATDLDAGSNNAGNRQWPPRATRTAAGSPRLRHHHPTLEDVLRVRDEETRAGPRRATSHRRRRQPVPPAHRGASCVEPFGPICCTSGNDRQGRVGVLAAWKAARQCLRRELQQPRSAKSVPRPIATSLALMSNDQWPVTSASAPFTVPAEGGSLTVSPGQYRGRSRHSRPTCNGAGVDTAQRRRRSGPSRPPPRTTRRNADNPPPRRRRQQPIPPCAQCGRPTLLILP